MATGKPKRSPEVIEDILIQRIFLVKLTDVDNKQQVMYLERMAAENLREGKSLLLNRDLMEAIVVERLAGEFNGESVFQYFVGCYVRAFEEGKKIITNMKDVDLQSSLVNGVIKKAKKLVASYCRIYLCSPDKFPNSEKISAGSALLPLIFHAVSDDNTSCRNEFLNEFFTDTDYDTVMAPIFKDLYDSLNHVVSKVNDSEFGDFVQPLKALRILLGFPNGGKALVSHPLWLPKGADVNGRMIEKESILGSFFRISDLSDITATKHDIDEILCSSDASTSHTLDISLKFLRTSVNDLHNGLKDVISYLLNSKDTRECVLEYIGDVVKKNSSRAHMQVDTATCASSGMFFNLSVVMLRLCMPFLTDLTKRDKIDATYVSNSTRLDLRALTRLHASSEESGVWADENKLKYGNRQYSFICECFFLTARVLNLGLLKLIYEYKNLKEKLLESTYTLTVMQMQPPSKYFQEEIASLNKIIDLLSKENSCYESHLLEGDSIQHALSFYRLMIVWLVDSVGGFKMPLPSSCPMEFGCMPEQFVDDAMELLIFASAFIPHNLDPILLNDFTNFIIMFIASPNHVRNPYLRAKMVTVLNCSPKRGDSYSTVSTFQDLQLVLGPYLVQSVLKFYVDIEFTGSDNQFLEKFMLRHETAELLKYLWREPSHRDAWIKFAKQEEKGVYLNFLNFLINDSIYLLDEGFSKIRKLKEMEKDREDRSDQFRSQEDEVRKYVTLALEDISTLAFTSEQITAPFLLPQMVDRIANMLNYFLVQLVGPKRKSLHIKNAAQYGFEPKILLKKIISIYIHIAREDKENTFAAAICKDGRSYNDRLFTEVVNIPGIGEEGIELQEFVNLGAKVKLAASEAMDAESTLGEIPDDFLDPIQCTLMTDPVILPSSKVTVDRSVIQRHLLSDNTDPFNRSHLTQNMLIPNAKLKSQIDEFIKSRNQHPSSS
ncbi:hypothetical protein MKX01_031596 [Papaver californicum]|nr:hypothetical protein MKX01_031596 [Papaver californicum]